MLLSFSDSLSGLFLALLGVYLFPFTSATKLHFFLGGFLHFITGDDKYYFAVPEGSPESVAKLLISIWPDKGSAIKDFIEAGQALGAVAGDSKFVSKTRTKYSITIEYGKGEVGSIIIEKGPEGALKVWEKLSGKPLSKALKALISESASVIGSLGISLVEFGNEAEAYRIQVAGDTAAFDLLELIGMETTDPSLRALEHRVATAKNYATFEDFYWFFAETTHVRYTQNSQGGFNAAHYPSAFSNLMTLKRMKDSGRSTAEIQDQIQEYWSDYSCGFGNPFESMRYMVTQNPRLNEEVPYYEFNEFLQVYVENYENCYLHSLKNYEETLEGVKERFAEYMQEQVNQFNRKKEMFKEHPQVRETLREAMEKR